MGWSMSGRYVEACNCDYLCPCGPTGLTAATHDQCIFAMGLDVEKGDFNGTSLHSA